jgi:dinuclear metal center YbgI/SA1388 family protein
LDFAAPRWGDDFEKNHTTHISFLIKSNFMISFQRSAFLQKVLPVFDKVSPLSLADSSWDNVGLIFESIKEPQAAKIMLTIDLTLPVLEEAISKGTSLIMAYHPPWFKSQKQMNLLTLPVVTIAANHNISLYSMHSSLDSMSDGLNDWILEASFNIKGRPFNEEATTGLGRIAVFEKEITLLEAVNSVKKALKLDQLRVAKGSRTAIKSVAVCAGSGSSVLKDADADLFICGEMTHHDILLAVSKGSNVILCEHSNSERGFLNVLRERLSDLLPLVEIFQSEVDTDPIRFY